MCIRDSSTGMTELVKCGSPVSKLTLIERSGSAVRTAIEHLDRSIKVNLLAGGPHFTYSVVLGGINGLVGITRLQAVLLVVIIISINGLVRINGLGSIIGLVGMARLEAVLLVVVHADAVSYTHLTLPTILLV
eukprot:9353967-Pyramimonas_sp.AAC.1